MRISNGNIFLSSKKLSHLNFIEYSRKFYSIERLNVRFSKSRGGNSSVFKLIDPNSEIEYAIKFCKYSVEDNIDENFRFEREIEALHLAKKATSEYVIQIQFDGQKKINGKTFRYYVMEKADSDLRTFIIENNIAISQKIYLCYQLIKGIRELHDLDIYHRDIKPDNIFFLNGGVKIGDLGLIAKRDEDLSHIEYQKKVGPVGWLSPEVMNKVLCEGTRYERINDCVIDTLSDIFQLGKVFWFIFKYNVPIGQILYTDFDIPNETLYANIYKMIQYTKARREDLGYFENAFMQLAS
jgi:serine/threonine protein kinase